MACGKIKYLTKRSAKIAMKLLNKSGKLAKPLRNIYYCEECSGFHHTSQNKKQSRRFTKQLNKSNEPKRSK